MAFGALLDALRRGASAEEISSIAMSELQRMQLRLTELQRVIRDDTGRGDVS
jgi:hypothetical protein